MDLHVRTGAAGDGRRGWALALARRRGVELISGVLYTVLIDSNAKMRGWTWRVAVGPREPIEKREPIGKNCHPTTKNRSKP